MSTSIVNMHEAKTRLSELVALALAGEEVIIARANQPLVRLTPLPQPSGQRRLGRHRGQIEIAEDFDAPLPEDFWLGDAEQ
ncbi:MAG: type II toxin-antitoxin system Phd/YefM family antitoxin [Gammaproteobacteria bacterium]